MSIPTSHNNNNNNNPTNSTNKNSKMYEYAPNAGDNSNNPNNNASNEANARDENLNEKKKKVGNYIISKTIGEGSFAKVRLGYHLITQQMVAVKVINKKEVLKRNYLRANLRREACMMQRMQHPHIIQLYEVMETENCYYIVMELIDGIEFVKYLSKK
jgi:serine/threonine protein kinase